MSWGTRRRNTIIFLVVIVLIIPVIVGAFLFFYKPPSCFDGKQNADEVGVDCGGSCELLCTVQTFPPTVVWERFFEVSPGVYNVVAYVENQNSNAGINNAQYSFKLFNRDNVLIGERKGSVSLDPKSILPIIENSLITLKQVPERVSFDFTSDLVFEKKEAKSPSLIVKDEDYFVDNFPKVSAKIQNITLKPVFDIKIVVLLYDVFDNVVGSSNTFLEVVNGEDSRDITFTWPNSFKEEVTRIEIFPIYEPTL